MALFTLIVILLFHAPAVLAAAGDASSDPHTRSAVTPEAPPPACLDCGLRYFPPSATPPGLTPAPSFNAAPETRDPTASGAPSNGPADVRRAPASPGRSHLSSDPQVNTARALIESQHFAEALQILRPLAPDHPNLTDVRFLLGLAASRGSQTPGLDEETQLALLDEAIAAFRSILIHRPELVRVRLELALAFFLKGEDQLARGHFDRALVGRPPAALVGNINRFLNTIRERRRWRGYFGFSVAPDTNINAASDAQFIYIQGLPFRRGGQAGASSDIGIVGWGGGEYQFPLAADWRLRSGIDLNHREYKGRRFDQTYAGVYVGPRWLIDRNTEMSLLASVSQRWFGQYSFNYDYGARLEVEHRVYAGLRLSGRALWSDRKYQQQKFLEGPLMVFSLGATYVPFPIMSVNLLVGYQQQEAVSHQWNNAGYWTRVGTNVALPWGFSVGLSGEFRWTDYEGNWFPFTTDGSTRADQTRILRATLLNRAITVYGFSPQVAFSNQVRESNAQLFDFKRNLVEMRWVRQF